MTLLVERATAWAARVTFETLPAEVVECIKLRILDSIGVMLAAGPLPLVSQAKRAALALTPGGGARIIGDPDDVSLMTAAFVNGVRSAVLEFDDTHIESFIHPTAPVVAVAFPEARMRRLGGRALLAAVSTGMELTCRLGLVPPTRLHEIGYHPTAVFGGFGGVFALSHLRGHDQATTLDALGAAGSLAAGINASFEDGSSTKMMHIGMAATGALRAMALAEAGVSGPRPVFEGRFGFFRTHVQNREDHRWHRLLEALGEGWEVLAIASKVYPCAFTMLPHIECAIHLKETHAIRPEDVVAITARIGRRSFKTVCEPVEDKRRPATSWHGRISLQHTVAEALVRGRMDKTAYSEEAIRDPVINRLADLVMHEDDPATVAHRSGGEVIVTLRDGRVLSHRIEDMRGTIANPMTRADIVAKFRANARGVVPDDQAERAIEEILGLESCPDVAPVLDRLVPR
jgi:2-methylcitrate dehydratase PrpD